MPAPSIRVSSLVPAAALLVLCRAGAQDLEPRQYSNVPVGMNFLIAGYASSDGGVLFDPSIVLDNAQLGIDGPVVGYARGLSLGGLSAKVDAGVSRVCMSGSADFEGQRVSRSKCGLTDAKARLSVNFVGAPALTAPQFASYRQGFILGASLQLGVPVGDYTPADLINIGANRWSGKAEIGFSKALPRRWVLELALSGTFFEANGEFRGSSKREQDPIYALQLHAVRSLPSGVWISVDSTHYRGGQTRTDGVENPNQQSNDRLGLTVSVPINRAQSIKLYYSSGVTVRTGTDFDTVGAAWQYRWGGRT
ncbi:MAG TPA: transporter [Gammaproteobacteria bacterium]|nr:transporter [Gammaproteobacteria bacterium]